jgi:hypothetical protein
MVAYLGNVYLVARLSVDNLNKQCFHNTTYTYIYVLRTTVSKLKGKEKTRESELARDVLSTEPLCARGPMATHVTSILSMRAQTLK